MTTSPTTVDPASEGPGMPTGLRVSGEAEVLVIHLDGDVDVSSGLALRRELMQAVARAQPLLVIDLETCTFIDVGSLVAVIDAARRAQSTEGRLLLANTTPFIASLMSRLPAPQNLSIHLLGQPLPITLPEPRPRG